MNKIQYKGTTYVESSKGEAVRLCRHGDKAHYWDSATGHPLKDATGYRYTKEEQCPKHKGKAVK